MKYIIGNWKANLASSEISEWLTLFFGYISQDKLLQESLHSNSLQIILAPPALYLKEISQLSQPYTNICVAAQDVSQFSKGNYTGEVTARMLEGLVEYSIVGHSERRRNAHEDENTVKLKIENLKSEGIQSILCVRNETDVIYESAALVAFEPVTAIANGKNDDVIDVLSMKNKLSLHTNQPFLYGGSVDEKNASSYLAHEEISGFLVGTASLNPLQFYKVISQFK
jgi:triosephosphate isomerase (TIM)